MYYGSKELFLDERREYFKNNYAKSVAETNNVLSLDISGSLTEETVFSFISSNQCESIVVKMFHALVNEAYDIDKKKIVICDKKENIILWIGALSVLLPLNIAKELSFSTYSNFSGTISTMVTGVYTPAVNGLSVENNLDRYPTGYSPEKVDNREDLIIFDFERDYISSDCEGQAYFDTFLYMAMEDTDVLKDYQSFISNETSLCDINPYYEKGYAYYMIVKKGNGAALVYLEDARDFAKKYMRDESVKLLLEKAFSLIYVEDDSEIFLNDMVKLCSDVKYDNSKVAFSKFLVLQILKEDVLRETFLNTKELILDFFKEEMSDFCNVFISDCESEEYISLITETNKKWKYMEIFSLLLQCSPFETKSVEHRKLFEILIDRIFNDDKNREKILSAYLKTLRTKESKAILLKSIKNIAPVCKDDVLNILSREYFDVDTEEEDILFITEELSVEEDFAENLKRSMEEPNISSVKEKLLKLCKRNSYSRYAKDFSDELYKKLLDSSKAQYPDGFDMWYDFAKKLNTLESEHVNSVVSDYISCLCYDTKFNLNENNVSTLFKLYSKLPDETYLNEVSNILNYYKLSYIQTGENVLFNYEVRPFAIGILSSDEREKIEDTAATAFYKVSEKENSASKVNFEKYFDINDEDSKKMLGNILKNQLKEILSNYSDKKWGRVVYVVAVLSLMPNVDFAPLGTMMYKNKIKFRLIEEELNSTRLASALREKNLEISKDKTKKALDEIKGAYDVAASQNIFGILKGKGRDLFSAIKGKKK